MERNHNNFFENLEFSSEGERIVAKKIETQLHYRTIFYYKKREYDLYTVNKYNNKVMKVEVKEDVKAKTTGNVVIENKSRGHTSGIDVTEADVWVFRIHQPNGIHHLLYKIADLKGFIKNKEYVNYVQMENTDSNNWLYLFKFDFMYKNAYMRLKHEGYLK